MRIRLSLELTEAEKARRARLRYTLRKWGTAILTLLTLALAWIFGANDPVFLLGASVWVAAIASYFLVDPPPERNRTDA